MKFTTIEKGFIIRLEKGESLMETLTRFCLDQSISNANFNGIGAVLQAELGFYHLERKEYSFKVLKQPMEIVNLQGNVSLVEGKPFLHIHILFSDPELQCFGGHLKEAIIGATCEIYLFTHSVRVERVLDCDIGLKLLDLKE